MQIRFFPQAKAELFDALAYPGEPSEAANRFSLVVDEMLERMANFSKMSAATPRLHAQRRALLADCAVLVSSQKIAQTTAGNHGGARRQKLQCAYASAVSIESDDVF